ncbi:MAG: restriction endonuclease [Clostridiales bacterium]|nr:restriction endonuclease [Clostridiales bacterium]
MRNFDEWLGKFKFSISGYDYYVDFDKVTKNVEKLKVELNILNSLIGSKNIEDEFEKIIMKYPETLKCIPLLLAVRGNEIYVQDEEGAFIYRFDRMNYTLEQYKIFMEKTGLFDLISNHLVNNLVDYALGVETGLDTNGRKNRGGHQMENLVESYIKKAGFIKNETNFYGGISGGSKLNETARSYKMLAQEASSVDGFTFVWITDGTAWRRAKGNLKETFIVLDTIFNIDDMENGIMETLFM